MPFGVQYLESYGSFGEFTVGVGERKLTARYLQTKIRPGANGDWENELASAMKPWREVFDIEELSFDELLQRDLNDSRVAHDLIPYLLEDNGYHARFFPPILAVIVPRGEDGKGIKPLYPRAEENNHDEGRYNFHGLFKFEPYTLNNQQLPLATLSYNRQQSAFVIVDGQHRAMAALALHRQLNQANWGNDRYESYYSHINVSPDQVSRIELPVCIVFFPELHEGNRENLEGADLKKICRELFLVVNRSAQPVSETRELLLDDEDLSAMMMRKTLSKLKNRPSDQFDLARVYSFDYGDSEDTGRSAVSKGIFDYCTAITLHKLHSASSFGMSEGFNLQNPKDLSTGTCVRNPERPSAILLGTKLERLRSLSRRSGKSHEPDLIDSAVSLLGELNDIPILNFFDGFRVYQVHNGVLKKLQAKLNRPEFRADEIQKKCYTILFEGSGVREVFRQHLERLSTMAEDRERQGLRLSQALEDQRSHAQSVAKAVQMHEKDLQKKKACTLYQIDESAFDAFDQEMQTYIIGKSRSIFQTASTQAFQLGFVAAVHTLVELIIDDDVEYDDRVNFTIAITDLLIRCLNTHFCPDDTILRKSPEGLIKEKRMNIYDTNASGLRGLLSMSVNEINERQWVFFRWSILEIMRSDLTKETRDHWTTEHPLASEKLVFNSETLYSQLDYLEKSYIDSACAKALKEPNFIKTLEEIELKLRVSDGLSDEEITRELESLEKEKIHETTTIAKTHIESSLGSREKELFSSSKSV